MSEIEALASQNSKRRDVPRSESVLAFLYFAWEETPFSSLTAFQKSRRADCLLEFMVPSSQVVVSPLFLKLVSRETTINALEDKEAFRRKHSRVLSQLRVVDDPLTSLFVSLKEEADAFKKQLFISLCCKSNKKLETKNLLLIKTLSKMADLYSSLLSAKDSCSLSNLEGPKKPDLFTNQLLKQIHMMVHLRKCRSITEFEGGNEPKKPLPQELVNAQLKESMAGLCEYFLQMMKCFGSGEGFILYHLFQRELIGRGFLSLAARIVKIIVYTLKDPNSLDPGDEGLLSKCLQILALLSWGRDSKTIDQFIELKILVLVKQAHQFLEGVPGSSDLCLEILQNVLDALHRSELRNPLIMNLVNYVYLHKD